VTTRLLVAALVLAGATVALGIAVDHRPPSALDAAGVALRGVAVRPAEFFTALGRWWMLVPIGVATFAIAMFARANVVPLLVIFGAQAVSQPTNYLLKLAFGRIRPAGFIGPMETDPSFPSGHSVTAIVFFAGLAALAWNAPVPRPVAVAATVVLAICVAGIPWSRLALGAHYATDVLGGLLFGGAWLSVALAVMIRLSAGSTR
jgi:membrane-associated phospholipid phosphatase